MTATKAFKITFVAAQPTVTSSQGVTIKADFDFEDAHDELKDFDVLIIPGGATDVVLRDTSDTAEPMNLIRAFTEVQKADTTRERTLLTVCTGSLLAAQAGILQGLAATTHPDYYTRFENLCKEAALKGTGERTDVMEERYVVNNARFDLGENLDENPFILAKRPEGRRKSIARKGSNAFKESNQRRESFARRSNMRLGGLRVITSGGITTGLDASLYLVAALVSHESALEVARYLQYGWEKGVVVESIDV
jgi:transcriptional regulator GlxA family with amidase domain